MESRGNESDERCFNGNVNGTGMNDSTGMIPLELESQVSASLIILIAAIHMHFVGRQSSTAGKRQFITLLYSHIVSLRF